MDLSLYYNDELLRRRRNRVKDSPNDKSFTVYFPFHSDPQTFTHRQTVSQQQTVFSIAQRYKGLSFTTPLTHFVLLFLITSGGSRKIRLTKRV